MWPFMIDRTQRKQEAFLFPLALLCLPLQLAMTLVMPGLFILFVVVFLSD